MLAKIAIIFSISVKYGNYFVVLAISCIFIEKEIIPVKVIEKEDSLFYTYKIRTGEQQSFSSQPLSIIILDKQYEDKHVILLNE